MDSKSTIERIQGIQNIEGITRDEMLKSVRVGQKIGKSANGREITVLKKSFEESDGGWFIEIDVDATPSKWRSEKVVNQDEMLRYIENGNFLTHPEFPTYKVEAKDLVSRENRFYFRILSVSAA